MAWRFWGAILVVLAGPTAAQPAWTPPDASEWQQFQRRYMAPEGRIVDTANGGISHSEGQGYGMFFATHFGDRPAFERLWRWTRLNLSRPTDSLHAWRYTPHGAFGVQDTNNATDGDLYIAWALLRAAERWNEPEWHRSAARIAHDVLACCVRRQRGHTLLLPGAHGFERPDGIVVNLSYYAFPVLRALSRIAPDPAWAELERDGLALMRTAAFGRWHLPPDWLLIPASGAAPSPAAGWPPRFSWDALRVPLNLAWQRFDAPTTQAALQFWDYPGHAHRPPAWVELRSNSIAPYPGHSGVQAVHMFLRLRHGASAPQAPGVARAPDYYAAAVGLQARIAYTMAPEPPAELPATAAATPRRSWIGDVLHAAGSYFATEEHEHAPPAGPSARPTMSGVRRTGAMP
ncbi:MAG: glycosyl hydrolase family 5 [Acetobacteraceae bacterium]|nr:glycosyl hydrolase family 5 [Acetobacteraceae bacterium]